MKKLSFLLFLVAAVFYLNAQTVKNRVDPFTGTSKQAADWLGKQDQSLRSIAGEVNKVISYTGKTEASGTDDVALSLYDFTDLQKAQIGTVLEITENSTGNVIFIVWSNESSGSKAIFYNDDDKVQLDVSFSTRRNKFGMGNDTVKFVKTIIKELK
jgi:hypothetical protein